MKRFALVSAVVLAAGLQAGTAFGAEMFKVAEVGKVKQVSYLWPKPGSSVAVEKVSYVTRVGDPVCGVGYCK